MKSLGNVIVIAITSLTLNGCIANMNSVRHKFKISDGKSQLIDVKQRSILVSSKQEKIEETIGNKTTIRAISHPIVCAEPSPDAMSAYAAEMAAKGGSEGKAYGELSAAMQESASFVGMRTASIQALRDYGYRICEAYMSGAINEIQYESLLRRYQKNLVVLFTIEQLSGVNRVPTIALISQGAVGEGGIIQNLETQKKKLKDENDQLTASETGKTKEEKQSIETEIKANTDQITKIDTTIETLKKQGMNSSASIVTIPTTTPTAADISVVATNVYKLADSMIRSDEYGSLCLSLVQQTFMKDNLKPYQIEEGKKCVEYLEKVASEASKPVQLNGENEPNPTQSFNKPINQLPVWSEMQKRIINIQNQQ